MNHNNPSDKSSTTFFGASSLLMWVSLGVVFSLALAIRLYDLTDPPLDFHSTRQLRSALIARGMYYQGLDSAPTWQRERAVEEWQSREVIEPTLFEALVAQTYHLTGGENVWVARIYGSIFWLVGGLALYLLARDMTSVDGGLIALTFYLLLPFGVIASRSFQPDPLMVMWIVLAWWAFYRWYQAPSWKSALLAGATAGIALLIKNVAVFMLLGGTGALILTAYGIRKALRSPQIWAIAILSALPVAVYTIYGLLVLELAGQFEGRFFPELLSDSAHYAHWVWEVLKIIGFGGLLAGLLGVFLFDRPHQKAFVIGLWSGYGVYGLLFPYHFLTHNYYHLPLIPVVALCIAPFGALVFQRISEMKLGNVARIAIIGVFIICVAIQVWDTRVTLAQDDYRHEPAYWQGVGEVVGTGTSVVALSQDYGNRIAYYGWVDTLNWPGVGHQEYRELRGGKPMVFEDWFAEYTAGQDYFLVTRLKELDRQPELKEMLYENYPIIAQGDGYLLFDLNNPTH
jgi:4-amino-4-deoxy-L-arabinose transferase-like glycosyltransferase